MFRRLASSLPQDPVFATDLKGLGYFINDQDEIRSIDNPKAYFKYFLTKNTRHNDVQREAMNGAIRDIIFERLENIGLKKILLPLGATETERNLPIFVSSDLSTKKRVVILFYEHGQDLGVFTQRIIGGRGGINAGSAIDFVKYIQSQHVSPDDGDSPGVILANMGQMRWWRRGRKAVTQTSWLALPQKSAVERPYRLDPEKNTIPGSETPEQHVDYIFNTIVEKLVNVEAKLDIVAVSSGAVSVSQFLGDIDNFSKWGPRLSAFVALATTFSAVEIQSPDFADWLLDRGRVYAISDEPAGTLLAGPKGSRHVMAYGCPVFSLAEPYYSETILPKGYKIVLDWFQEVADTPGYANPTLERIDVGGESDDEEASLSWGAGNGAAINGIVANRF